MPRLRARVRRRARPGAASVGRGRRGDGGSGLRCRCPTPEAAVIAEDSFGEQSLALATELPERPLVLGGCCCAHVGAVEALAARLGRIAVVWFDAHGDLNTAESSPSGNLWGMPLRMLIDSGAVGAEDVALVGARNLDPPEEEFIAASGVHVGDGGDRRSARRSRGRLCRVRCRRARSEASSSRLHAGAARPEAGRGRSGLSRESASTRSSWAPASRP